MKKSKLSIGLVTSFIGALALTSCGDTPAVTTSKTSVVDFIGYNSKTNRVEINVDELYREYGESKEGTTMYYNAILESLIRYEYPKLAADTGAKEPDLKKYSRIKSEAADKMRAVKQTAEDNANNNGTDFEDEWEKILESNDVESEKELKEKFIYELEKEAIEEWYFKKNSEDLRKEYIGVSSDWKEVEPTTKDVEPVYPYHVVHILVKLTADANDYTRAQITEGEAQKLWQIVSQLCDGNFDFEKAALRSEDSSNTEYGDVELMSVKTSFYNEFKLGTYAFDALLSGVNAPSENNSKYYKAFGMSADAEVVTKTMSDKDGYMVETKERLMPYEDESHVKHEGLIKEAMSSDVKGTLHISGARAGYDDLEIPAVPFHVFKLLDKYAKEDKIGTFVPEGSASSLPRNVLFNAFLNFRSPFVITNETLDIDAATDAGVPIKEADYKFDDESILGLDTNNFMDKKVYKKDGTELGQKVLCDNRGNVIIGVRSSAGIHFMVMRKSVFENTNKMAYQKNGQLKSTTNLVDYYTTKTPYDKEGYPTGHETYVDIQEVSDISYYQNRANTIKNDIKSSNFDAAYDYRLYETLLNYELFDGDKPTVGENIHFSDEVNGKSVIRENIDKTIALLRETSKYSQEESMNKAWKEYLIQLMNQNEWRSETGMYEGAFVPTTCAFSFKKGNENAWKENDPDHPGKAGKCYVK